MVACQALAGEPVSLCATMVIAGPPTRRCRVRAGATSGWRRWSRPGSPPALLLAAIQYVPLGLATRSLGSRRRWWTSEFWAFHPLALFELLVPHFFGDYFHSNLRELVWMIALNSQRDPFYYTMYVGVPVVLLAGRRDGLVASAGHGSGRS